MKIPQIQSRSAGARRAWAQPRFLLGAATLALVGGTWASFAAPSINLGNVKEGVAMPHMSSSGKPYSLANLPAMVERYGQLRRLQGISSGLTPSGLGRTAFNVGTGQTGFNLVERDLTAGANDSDEREPASSPSGDFIAFTSTGADTNNDGKIDSVNNGAHKHIWIMNRDGTGQRQLTGLNAFDVGRDQSRPTWSPEGNTIAYSDEDTDGNGDNVGGSQLWVVSTVDSNPTPAQRTFFAPGRYGIATRATVTAPAWSPNGLSIAFVTNFDGRNNTLLPTKDIFTIAPSGSLVSLTRVTGETDTSRGSTDAGGSAVDRLGNGVDDDNPTWAVVNTSVLYFSSNRDINGQIADDPNTAVDEASTGRRIWRAFADGTGIAPVTNPIRRTNGQASDRDDFPNVSLVATDARGATVRSESVAFQTNTYLDNTDQADGTRGRDLNIWTIPAQSGTYSADTTPTSAQETATGTTNGAEILTNILSSPANFEASRLTAPQTIDRAADREPSFSRNTQTQQSLAQLTFASSRTYAPNTSSNTTPTATPVPTATVAPGNVATATPVPTATTAPTPVPVNRRGGDQLNSNGDETGVLHDIWATSTDDVTPPALVPQAVGNLQSPVVAPQADTRDAPFFAARTPEFGLKPGLVPTAAELAEILNPATTNNNTYAKRGGLRFAVVLRDTESGLQETTSTTSSTSAIVRIYNADGARYSLVGGAQNENSVYVQTPRELKPLVSTINNATSFALNVYDDGPVSNGGHEQEAGAIAGDGNYYCEGLIPTPAEGDYYIDVTTTDRVVTPQTPNSITYDNIWGFSTRRFTRQNSGTSDLFVSDYACGQTFPYTLSGDARFFGMVPIESYYLDNPATTGTNSDRSQIYGTSLDYAFIKSNVDIWRILCRGSIPQDVLNSYRPTIVRQIDPNVPNPTEVPQATPSTTATPVPGATATPTPAPTATATAGPTPTATATPLPYSKLTRNVAVANQCIIWAAPYTGAAFVGPGSLIDSTTQANLSSFMQDGGRLFMSGRDIAYGLSSAGTVATNSFLNNELATTFSGEVNTVNPNNVFTAVGNKGILYRDFFIPKSGPIYTFDGDFLNLEFPYRFVPGDTPTYYDAALTSNPSNEFQFPTDPASQPDLINPSAPANTTLTSDYEYNGQLVAQRILHTKRNNGLESRAVYFSFGFESINRRWRIPTPGDSRSSLNHRAALAAFILRYFKTTGISGKVINNATNLPVPNFLISVVERDFATGAYVDTFYARTDANGNYAVTGLPNNSYTISAYTTNTSPPLTSPQGYFGGTPIGVRLVGGDPITTDLNLRVIPTNPGSVLGRAVTSNGTFANRTDDSPLANIPVLIRSVGESPAFVPSGTGRFSRLTSTNADGDFTFSSVPALAEMEVIINPNVDDVPAGSNITYTEANRNPNFGRRLLPDTTRPLNPIIVPSGDNFYLNDVGTITANGNRYTVTADNTSPDTAADQKVPIIVPRGPTITGIVSINGAAASGATVRLLPVDGNGNTGTTDVSGSPVQYSSGTSTATDGKFSFIDVPAKNTAAGGTRYVIRATVTRDNAILVRDVPVTLYQGNDLTQNVDFTLATITGRVLQNGSPVANATVTLQDSDGATFVPSRTTKTNTSGVYTLNNVPVAGYTPGAINGAARTFTYTSSGGVINYQILASLNSQTGTTTVAVRAADTRVTASDITLRNQQLSGTIQLQVDNNAITNLGGATVELLNEDGTAVRSTTSGSDGTYGFTITTAGTYQVRSTYKGDTITSEPFDAPAGTASPGPDLINRLRTISGTITDSTNKNAVVVGATVTVKSSSGTTLATTTSGAGGKYQTAAIAPGTNYTVSATKASLSGSTLLKTLTRGAYASATVNVSMKSQVVVAQNPTTFTKGMTYAVSFPYETSSNATTRNVYDRAGGDSIVLSSEAFNYPQTGVNSSGQTVRYYSISRFDSTSLTYVPIADNANLIRGQGYLLQVSATPADGTKLRLLMPADNSRLKALTAGGTAAIEKFTISLVWNASTSGDALNGRNFIGFGLNPAKYSAIAWDTTNTNTDPAKASVQVIDGSNKYTLYQAVQKSIIAPSLTTVESSTGRSVTTNSVAAYGGYFVTVRKAGVKLLFQFPQSNN